MDNYSIMTVATHYVAEYHYLGYLIVGLGSFMEAVPFSGLLIPGNIMLVVAGILSYEGYLGITNLIILATVGAILGDLFAYYIGLFYNRKKNLADVEREDVYPLKRKYLEKADHFCQKHGGKGVFFGRFIGPLRPFVAFIAGIGNMPFKTFMFYNVSSAILWAFGFLLLGYLFEGSLRLVDRIEHYILITVIVATLLYLIRFYLKKEIKKDETIDK